jgi:S-adenosylmethionine hydrolase
MSPRIITLLTDFGTEDYFVGAMKGVILTRSPEAVVVDITHAIPPQDVRAGAFTLSAVYSNFPAGSIHLAVVDPGVGSDRRPVLIEAADYLFIGPDNGLFSIVLDRVPGAKIRHVTNSDLFPAGSKLNFPRSGYIRPCRGRASARPTAWGAWSDYSRPSPAGVDRM